MQISFFIPKEHISKAGHPAAWDKKKKLPLYSDGKNSTFQSWIYQTWAALQAEGIDYQIVSEIPQSGILIILSTSCYQYFKPSIRLPTELFIVDVVADDFAHPAAHLHLVQNRWHARYFPRSFFMPHAPQPQLIRRNSERGTKFENVHFFGYSGNIAQELLSEEWKNELRKKTGLYFNVQEVSTWHDYSTTDCVLGLRDFSFSPQFHKPATKLYNAWLAGVPFIGGRDSAYKHDGHPGKDYLIATSPKQVITHLQHLQEDASFRVQLVEQGTQSVRSFTKEATLERWKNLLRETLPQLARQHKKRSSRRRYFFSFTQQLFCTLDHQRQWKRFKTYPLIRNS